MNKVYFVLLLVATWASFCNADPKLYAVMVSATVTESPPSIALDWSDDRCTPSLPCEGFTVLKRVYDSSYVPPDYVMEWPGVPLRFNSTATGWVDTDVIVGVSYQYEVQKTYVGFSGSWGNPASTNLLSGIKIPMVDFNGIVLLVVESTSADVLSGQLQTMEDDLIGDGWQVKRITVLKSETVAQVKVKIMAAYNEDPVNTKSIYIFGDVAVPYSGEVSPDGHTEHTGAWPADMFYADVVDPHLCWTDRNNYLPRSGVPSRNVNLAGDGKFDQSSLHNCRIELEIGRVDLADFTAKTETTLLSNYITKNHNFRHGITTFARRGLIRDYLGDYNGHAFVQSGWRAFTTMFSPDNFTRYYGENVLEHASTTDYLFYSAAGAAGFEGMAGTGSTADYATYNPKFVFTMQVGSFFGDFDVRDNFLKAPLAYGDGLIDVWAGRPRWDFYYMSLGLTTGRMALHNIMLRRQIHMALMGDPTLRLFVVRPVSDVTAVKVGSSARISWTASSDSNIIGYSVYRAPLSNRGAFTRLTSSFVTGTSWVDASPLSGTASYMVRAVKLEVTPSGSYYNPSQGIFVLFTNTIVVPTPIPPTPKPPTVAPVTGMVCAGPVSEFSVLSLRCPTGQKIASVPFASYGTPTGTCGGFQKSACHATNSLTIVQNECIGKDTCSVTASNSLFNDPCQGTFKQLSVQVFCSTPTTRCSSAGEDAMVSVNCPNNQKIASVDFASYGVPSGTCGSYAVGTCHAAMSLSYAQSQCLGFSSCSFSASNSVFADPCAYTAKWLGLQVTCL